MLSKLARDIPSSLKYEEDDAIEWAGEALSAIGAYNELEEKVYFLPVENYKCTIPPYTKAIVQIVKNNFPVTSPRNTLCTINCALKEEAIEETPCYVLTDCQDEIIGDYDIAYYRPFFSLDMDYGKWTSSNFYKNNWSLVRPSQHSFFNATNNTENLYQSGAEEYQIQSPFIKFSFCKGYVAVALTTVKLDANGIPLIPDSYNYTSAIVSYIKYKLMDKDFYSGREGSGTRLQKAERDWAYYCQQSSNESMMPNTIDEMETLRASRNYLLPRNNLQSNFFGNLGNTENRTFLRNTLKSRFLTNGYY